MQPPDTCSSANTRAYWASRNDSQARLERVIPTIIGTTTTETTQSSPGRTIARWVWRGILIIVLVLVVWFVLVPQFAGARTALLSLGHISAPLLVLGLGLELASIASYSALSFVTLNPTGRPRYRTVLRIDVATQGVNNAVPGGGPTSTAVKYRLLTLAGTGAANSLTGTIVEIATSVLTLGGLFGIGIALSVGDFRGNLEYVVAAIVVGGVALLSAFAVVLLNHRRRQTLDFVRRAADRIPLIPTQATVAFVDRIADQLAEYRSRHPNLLLAVAWAVANWLLDIAALWVFLLAFGYSENPAHLLVAYGLACLVGLVPITPGGLGIIEGVLVPAIVAFGTPQGIALLGVLSWRLVQYWLPMPLSVVAYASLRAGPLRRSGRATTGARAAAG
jgi:hypothetical protein